MNLFTFLSEHIQVIGWPTLLTMIWRASRYVTKAEERLNRTEATIELLAVNHLPHLELAMKEVREAVDRGFMNLGNQLLIIAKKSD